jgi:hypothetical protein
MAPGASKPTPKRKGKEEQEEEGKVNHAYASHENTFSRSFRLNVVKWHRAYERRAAGTNGPALRDPDGGPTLRDLCGFMLSLKDHNDANI